MSMRLSSFALLPIFIAVACATKSEAVAKSDTSSQGAGTATVTATDAAAVRQAIDSANARFVAALVRGDSTAATANYADDAIVVWPNEATWRGRDAITKGFGQWLAQMQVKEETLTTEDLMVSGDVAVETGTIDGRVQRKGGREEKETGRYLTVWKRQPDGAWKIVRDFSTVAPQAK